MSRYVLTQRSSLFDLSDGAASVAPAAVMGGPVYFVNNLAGSAGASGTKDDPFDEVSTAVTAWEAARLASWGGGTLTNHTLRATIFIQGTGTQYSALTALPSFCDFIGIGAEPRGNGSGIVRIGCNSAADGVTDTSGGIRGVNFYNIQFNTGGNFYAVDLSACYRSSFTNCTFGTTDTGATAYGGLRILTGSGVVIRNCSTVANSGNLVTGLTVGNSGGNFSQCLVEDNFFYGTTSGIANSAYLCDQTVFRNNTCYGGTYGIRDTSTETTIAGNAFYVNNFCAGGTTGISIASTGNAAYQAMGNFTSDAGENRIYSAPIVEATT
jgi:hypothetical protein